MRTETDSKGSESTTLPVETKTTEPNVAGTLYYSARSCGAASFLGANIAGLRLATESVDLETHKTQSGIDFKTINPKGNVPTLILRDGTLLNEGLACLLWIADQNQSANLAPPNGTTARYAVMNSLSWIASELQPAITRLIAPNDDVVKKPLREKANKQLTHLERLLSRSEYLDGTELGVSDLICHIVVAWAPGVGLTLTDPIIQYISRVRAHPSVIAARAHMARSPSFTSANSFALF
jgi:glutathione S-transferase